jgi:hypothetical protein
MKTTTQRLIGNGELAYDTLFTNNGSYEWFKSNEDAYIYVLNTETGRATRYNAEGDNPHRIPKSLYGAKKGGMERRNEAKAAELDKAAEDENVSAEEFAQPVEDWNDVQDSHSAWTAVDEITYDVVAHAIRSFGKSDKETEEIMGMIGKDAKMVMEFNEATATLNADEFNAYIKTRLDAILNGGANGNATESLTEATEAHEEAETTEDTPDSSNATESLGEATENASKKKAKKARKSKDTFHTSTAIPGLTLTAKQTSFMLHLSDTCFWEEGLDSVIWVDCLCDDIQGEFAGKPMTVGAMISTLCEKKLGVRATERRDGKKCTSFALTELGKKVAEEVGLH